MSDWLPLFLRPAWLLALLPVALALWALRRRRHRHGNWQALLPPALQPWLLSDSDRQRSPLGLGLLGATGVLACLALAGPSWQEGEQQNFRRDDALVVVLALTPDLLATDVPPTRLLAVQRKLQDLLKARQDGETAIVVYAGSAHTLVPLTDDLPTIDNLLTALRPSIMPVPGQRADLGIAQALELLGPAPSAGARLLLIASELDSRERQGIERLLQGRLRQLAILGPGTPQGAPVAAETGNYLSDAAGGIRIARLDEGQLQGLARELGGRYQRLQRDDQDLRRLGLLDRPDEVRLSAGQGPTGWRDQGYLLLLPLLVLVACGARRGWLLCLPFCLLLTPPPAQAGGWDDLWQRRDQQAMQLLSDDQAAVAAERFNDDRWRGVALYRSGDYAAAAAAFAHDPSADGHYNRGNALAMAGRYDEALKAYAAALVLRPDLAAAMRNRNRLERLLAQRAAAQAEAAARRQKAQATATNAKADEPSSASSSTPETAAASPQFQAQAGADWLVIPSAVDDPQQEEQRQAAEQWLREIPDNPADLLRRKFWYQQQQREETALQ
ncbi:tetratricopeptide repeat protein [Pseudomonas oryzihabitans]|uniref:tetratricopeptide repeat protein n=1 Tax=Pseudomonas oryzihabitans TaxID=47885 RepID=UPI0028945861|nr:tetratricopeptide repeat protein [Pseudomonas oryzihabitans]MDT3719780.1 tetratricopeptide repeat protein [Pseudomonas oryzihabitans]